MIGMEPHERRQAALVIGTFWGLVALGVWLLGRGL
jgi:hypothetical protein